MGNKDTAKILIIIGGIVALIEAILATIHLSFLFRSPDLQGYGCKVRQYQVTVVRPG